MLDGTSDRDGGTTAATAAPTPPTVRGAAPGRKRTELGSRVRLAWTAVLAATTAATTLHPEFESDPFWHMTLGRAVIEHRSRVVPEPSAFAAFSGDRVVPEWLWGVVTSLLGEPGGVAVAVLVALLAVGSAFATVRWLARWAPELDHVPILFVSGLALAVVAMRLRLRPESCAFVLVPVMLERYVAFARATGAAKRTVGISVVAIEILWAQLHGSFVLAPALFVASCMDGYLRGERRVSWRHDLLLLGALFAGLGSSAYGWSITGYLTSHLQGDARRHVLDWGPLTWADFSPSSWLDGAWGGPYGAVYAMFVVIVVTGTAIRRRVTASDLALAVIAAALLASGSRFLAMSSLLFAPLVARATQSIFEVTSRRRAATVAALAAGLAFLAQARGLHEHRGPLGTLGLEPGAFPTGARRYFERSGDAHVVITEYSAGAPLSYWLGPRFRTYVDARTPLHFDDTDFGVARDAMRSAATFERVAQRHHADGAVVRRSSGACAALARDWSAVVVEPSFTTFRRGPPAGRSLNAVAPCGDDYVAPDACRDGGTHFDADIASLSTYVDDAFADLLRAERILRCGGSPGEALEILPNERDSRAFSRARDRAAAAAAVATDQPGLALASVEKHLLAGDLVSLAIIRPALTDPRTPAAEAQRLLTGITARLDDRTPPDVRALAAIACAEVGDAECARFEATRAWAGGSRLATPTMQWLATQHPDPRARADVAAWLALPPPSVAPPSAPPDEVPDATSRSPERP